MRSSQTEHIILQKKYADGKKQGDTQRGGEAEDMCQRGIFAQPRSQHMQTTQSIACQYDERGRDERKRAERATDLCKRGIFAQSRRQ